MWTFIGTIASYLVTGIVEHFTHKRKIKELKQEAEIKAAEMEVQIASDADVESVKDQKTSFKDEYIVYGLWTLFYGLFIPFTRPFIVDGFKALEFVPEWYVYLLVISAFLVLGGRSFAKYVLPRIGKK